MASSLEYVEYVCDQMRDAGSITYKKMFGEYTVYCDAKVVGLVCDNQLFIKPTKAGEALEPDAIKEPPYKGAKPHLVLGDLDNRERISELIRVTCDELPLPKPKKQKQ